MTLRSDDYNHGPSLVDSPGKHTTQCEVVTTPASPPMIPIINGISTSFTDPNITFTHGSKIQSGGYPGAHTKFGFRGAEIVCYRPLCSGKASSSSCYTKSHVDTTSTCYLF